MSVRRQLWSRGEAAQPQPALGLINDLGSRACTGKAAAEQPRDQSLPVSTDNINVEVSLNCDCRSWSLNWPAKCRSCSEKHSDHIALSIGLTNAKAWPSQPRSSFSAYASGFGSRAFTSCYYAWTPSISRASKATHSPPLRRYPPPQVDPVD